MLSTNFAGSIAVVTPSSVHSTSRVSADGPVVCFRITPIVPALSLSSSMCLTMSPVRDVSVIAAGVDGLLGGVDAGVAYNLLRIFSRLVRFIGVFGRTCRWTLIIADAVAYNKLVANVLCAPIVTKHSFTFV